MRQNVNIPPEVLRLCDELARLLAFARGYWEPKPTPAARQIRKRTPRKPGKK